MTAAERHARLTAIVIRLDEMAAAFLSLDCEVRELLRAEFEGGATDAARAEAELSGARLPMIRRR